MQRDKILKALNKEITSFKRKRSENHTSIKNKTTKENYKLIKKTVAQKDVIFERNIKSRTSRKKERGHKKQTTAPQKGNRRFNRNIAVDKRKENINNTKLERKTTSKKLSRILQIKMRLICLMLYYLKTKKLY